MVNDIQIRSSFFESQNQLGLHVVVCDGETQLLSRPICCNDQAQVDALLDEASRLPNVIPKDVTNQLTNHIADARSWWANRPVAETLSGVFQAGFISSNDLEQMDVRPTWLVKNILVRDQPALLGGPKKSLKTSVAIDLAISLGSGTRFLNRFDVPERVKVAVLSGESGAATIKETALRICAAKKVKLSACEVLWGFNLPRLGIDGDLEALAQELRTNTVKVLFIDPAYLCLLAGVQDVQANNMFQVGPLLSRINRICKDAGVTLVLVHHTTKFAGSVRNNEGEPLELEDLAYSGFQEFARQWLLINRRQKFEPGSGKHHLWLNIGGSVGHSACWGVDINEGILREDFSGRRWELSVLSMSEAREQNAATREETKAAKKCSRIEADIEVIKRFFKKNPDGDTMTAISGATSIQARNLRPALQEMLERGDAVPCGVFKNSGAKGQKRYEGWRPTTDEEKSANGIRRFRRFTDINRASDAFGQDPMDILSNALKVSDAIKANTIVPGLPDYLTKEQDDTDAFDDLYTSTPA